MKINSSNLSMAQAFERQVGMMEEQERYLEQKENGMAKGIQKIEHNERVETGAVQFGDDWPGLFLRGDDCIGLLFFFQRVVSAKDKIDCTDYEMSELERIIQTIKEDVIISPSEMTTLRRLLWVARAANGLVTNVGTKDVKENQI